MNPATIILFLTRGEAKSLRTASIGNWRGRAIAAPRTEFDELLKREELELAGIYILLGTDPTSGAPTAYIGEAENLRTRLSAHRAREFVTAIVFASDELTKAHVKYLEGRLLVEATQVGRVDLQNAASSGAKLREHDLAEMEYFLSRIRQLLPILGSDLLTPITQAVTPNEESVLVCRIHDAEARGQRTVNGFVVYKGSTAVATERPGAQKHKPHIVQLRRDLIDDGGLVPQGTLLTFSRDIEFTSSSAAAAVVQGGAAAGPLEWKNKDGKTLKELDEQSAA